MSEETLDPSSHPRTPGAADGTADANSISVEPKPGDASADGDGPVVGRKRWIAAAAAAVGVALFAVPFLRGPGDGIVAEEPPVTTAAGPAGATCAAKNSANFNFTLKDSNGATVRLADYKGKVVLLNFWATWCGPCKVEIPEFVEAYSKYRDRGFVILGVLSEDDPTPKDLHDFMSEFKMNYPVLQQHAELEEAFGPLWALPTTFIIDRKGQVCTKHMGPVSKEALEREISGLL
jgi:peroxiredoxin